MTDQPSKHEFETEKHKKQVKKNAGRLTLWREIRKSSPVESPNLLGEMFPQL